MKRTSPRRVKDPRQREASGTVQPVLDAIARTAARLCEANDALIFQVEGDRVRWVAKHGRLRAASEVWDFPLNRRSVVGRAVVDRRAVHIHDLARAVRTQFPDALAAQRATGVRTILAAPLLRSGTALGTIVVRRTKVRPFTAKQIALLKTFADQAAIAIENARLSAALADRNRELTNALERETATSAILRTISSSPSDLQPVLDTIAASSVRLCGGLFSSVYRFDDGLIHMEAQYNYSPRALEESRRLFPTRPTRGLFTGRAILERAVIHVPDVERDPEHQAAHVISESGFRSVLSVPMLRDEQPIGAITVWRATLGPFSDTQVALLQTFADQAVIAIDNVRLFKELQTRNRDLIESLEQQTATSELLKVIGRSTSDLQPVFETLGANAVRLCEAERAFVFRFDGQVLRVVATYNVDPERRAFVENHPIAPGRHSAAARAALERRPIHIHDVQADPEYTYRVGQADPTPTRTLLGIPMLRADELLGVITIYRLEVRPFTDSQIALLETFADQAAIAIENARLLSALKEKNRALTASNAQVTEALDRQTATADVLRIIAQSPTELQPVLDAIAASAVRLCAASDAVIERLEGDRFYNAAHAGAQMQGLVGRPLPLTRRFPGGRAVLDRQPVIIDDIHLVAEREYPDTLELLELNTIHSVAEIPLLSEGKPLGTIAVLRAEVRPFTEAEVALLQTFADQAVIAIENVRLFKELETRNRDLTEALDQQTATSEILRVIASSPTDVQPVFAAVARSAARLCGAFDATIFQIDGDSLRVAVHDGPIASHPVGQGPSLTLGTPSGRAALDRRTINVADAQAEIAEYPEGSEHARRLGFRAVLAVPLMREHVAIGVINLRRTEARLFTERQVALLETFADQAVIAIENVRLFKELEGRNRDLTEALDRQTATSEILRVISRSPSDVQPTFEAIAASAIRLCEAEEGTIFRYDGALIHVAAHRGRAQSDLIHRVFPIPAGRGSVTARAVLTRAVVHVPDAPSDPELAPSPLLTQGFRTVLSVPMLRKGEPVGAITVTRREVAPFSDTQVALLQTFADQAVIAVENVRLFRELESRNRDLTEALEQQTATSEILRVISSSPGDLRPVFDTILANAARLCDAHRGALLLVKDGAFETAAELGAPSTLSEVRKTPYRPGARSHSLLSRVFFERRAMAEADIAAARAYQEGDERAVAAVEAGSRSMLAVPLLKDDALIGVITIHRPETGPFSDEHIALLKTFADQAVIAIENVRLFTELEARNRDLTGALDRETATSEILRVISSSPTDVQPVFDAIVQSAVRLCGAVLGAVYRRDGDLVHLVGLDRRYPEAEEVRAVYPAPVTSALMSCRAIHGNAIIHLPDTEAAGVLPPEGLRLARLSGFRSVVAVPMRREGDPIGAILVGRPAVGAFPDEQIALLQTFADQAVIAIENVRLFTELGARNRDLTEALEQQTATSEILRAISRSPTDVQPVLDAVVESAVRLCAAYDARIWRVEGDSLVRAAGTGPLLEESLQSLPLDQTVPSAAAFLEQRTVHVDETRWLEWRRQRGLTDPRFAGPRSLGIRSIISTPLMREGKPIGVLAVRSRERGQFTDKQIELLETFADQAVIAIENVRLFKELQARTSELTRSVDELTALGEVSRALSSTLDLETVLSTIVARANQLAGTDGCSVWEYDETAESFHLRATDNVDQEVVAVLHRTTVLKGEGAVGQMALIRTPVQIADIATHDAYRGSMRDVLLRTGTRALLAVPLLRDDRLVGGLTVNRKSAGEFPPETVELLKTFATQSALAINNARLFREIEDKGRQLEMASQHKSQFLANMSHELRTPLNAILGYTELIADNIYGEVPERMREVLERVDKSGRHLLGLINDILDLSKIEAGQLTLALTPYAMDGVAQTVATQVGALAAEKQLGFEVVLADDLPIGQGDERRLTQVLLNLVGNAIKFTDVGKVVVRVGTSDDAYVVSVTDTGPGIAEADREKIFEEFQQSDTTRAKAKGGTGLGLAISRRIVDMHGGRLWVESTLGEGSTFSFTVPVHVEHQVAVPRAGAPR